MNITIIGGDRRMETVAALLATRATVRFMGGAAAGTLSVHTLFSALSGAEAVIFPLPATRDGIHPVMSNTPAGEIPTFAEIFSRAEEECLFLGGALPPALRGEAATAGVTLLDYYESEVLLYKNAVATAEAAVAIAISQAPFVLFGTPVSVVGYGRIGAVLARLLRALGAEVTVFARSPVARAKAATLGCKTATLNLPLAGFQDTRVVFSTVPAPLFVGEGLAALPRGCFFLDLAGGGIDPSSAERSGIICPPALALPGRYSPESAGQYIFDEILSLIQAKRGVTL